ncbi:MAG: tRNA (N(6)-L-threonylcarbamoyladenosine(37)-C(2))-methylthiotransferase MtaB [Lachnospiraceae bacterium]|nr:tRNA (N(6)-L-threonylcarbamoyladenosine(37)-C(2))-methylthiotransferase MtaB [Lachnospiraceae bacterium]
MENKVNKKVAFHTLGCKVNICETEAMIRIFENSGYTVVDFNEKADIYVINTCSVTNIADRKSRQMIHRARKLAPDAVIVATGCYVEGLDEESARQLDCDKLIDNAHKNEIVARAEEIAITKMGRHTRADVKIEDGCNQFCSYCIIPYRRGRVSKRPEDSILREVGQLAATGHKEIVLTGIHISSYGRDELVHLITEIGKIDGIERIRLGSLEPRLIDAELLNGLKKVRQFCPHFHLSLQSGCDRTLKAMNRHYTADEYRQAVNLVRSFWEHPAVTTDVIAGFPGETEEDFETSKAFVDEMKFYQMHIFPYSRRKGTVADRMPNQLTLAEKQKRVDELEQINDSNTSEFIRYYIGREIEVLIEESDGEFLIGHTPEYVRVRLPISRYGDECINTLVKVTGESFILS